VARTPDNTFAPLEDNPKVLTSRQTERIQQIAHLLPLMVGEVVLPKLEAKGREWLERIRLETMKNDDRIRARQRFRVCVTAQRMTCCLMLCKVCEGLIQKHGLSGAESQLKQHPNLWKEMLLKAQTPTMLEAYDVIADSLLENALYFFRDRIENAFKSRDYAGNLNGERTKRGRNDSIFERLDIQFSFEQAMQQSVAVKGANVNHNTVRQMLKNWRKQKLVVLEEDGNYRKVKS
jgi:predicted transcriptional regulator